MANILVVDDDEIILKVAKAILTKAGHAVVIAKDGYTAIDIANQETFQLIITDANMPGGVSGFSLASTLRKTERTKDIPIMFLTGRREKADVARAVEVGVDDYSIKPIDQDIFLAKVEALLQAKRGVHSFSVTPQKTTGHWTVKFDIVGISEQGLSIQSVNPMPVQGKIRIESDLFGQMGITPPLLRIAVCQPVDATEKQFLISANFIGLNHGEQQAIRKWVMANNPRKSA